MSTVNCKNCNCKIKTPPSKTWRTKYCSSDCRDKAKASLLASRIRKCLICSKQFMPRKAQIDSGNGKYCSVRCRNQAVIPKLCTPESRQKALETYIQNMNAGLIKHKSGPNHPRWKGGSVETVKRRIADGRASKSVKSYRDKNPDKVREWKQSRSRRKHGRLPRGTVKSKQEAQQYRCVYCGTDTSIKFHVDHIVPLALGGKHEPDNIQITCPSCNLKKWIKTDFNVAPQDHWLAI